MVVLFKVLQRISSLSCVLSFFDSERARVFFLFFFEFELYSAFSSFALFRFSACPLWISSPLSHYWANLLIQGHASTREGTHHVLLRRPPSSTNTTHTHTHTYTTTTTVTHRGTRTVRKPTDLEEKCGAVATIAVSFFFF